MPLVQKTLTLTAGSTSDNILANTNYEFIDGNVRVRVASAADTAGTSATADNFLNVSVNNAEYSKDVSIPALVTGQPFGVLNGSYLNNDLLTTGSQRNRVLVTVRNDTAATRTYRIGVFIGG
jgi:small nuclear ribonucleoprotein (snRNP)-like protein